VGGPPVKRPERPHGRGPDFTGDDLALILSGLAIGLTMAALFFAWYL
jgi:hypothetical protein